MLGFAPARFCCGLSLIVLLIGQYLAGVESQRIGTAQDVQSSQGLAPRKLLRWNRAKCVTCPLKCSECECTACGTCTCFSCLDGFVLNGAACLEVVSYIDPVGMGTNAPEVMIVRSRSSRAEKSVGRTFGRWMIFKDKTSRRP